MDATSYKFPALGKLGESLGFAAGVAVTLALGLAPHNSKVRGSSIASPVPVTPITGRAVERRHDAVYGPQITAFADTLSLSPLHDVVLGFGQGATVAPSAAYQLEAKYAPLLGR
jgi:hypothetical protein